jgi:acyl-coenzyme A thioesterase PaaI-like protein
MLKSFNPMAYPRLFRMAMNSWPPYLGAGVCVEEIGEDWSKIRVGMKLRWYNKNYLRSHFGGSLFAMTDPFFVLMLMANLGKDYIVWDSSSKIKFIQPGRGKVTATFIVDQARLDSLRDATISGEKMLEKFRVDIVDADNSPVARVYKTIYIRKKKVTHSH